jgi:hypothetical protein
MRAQLIVAVILEAPDFRFLGPSVHTLDLAVGPTVVWRDQVVFDAVCLTDRFEAHQPGTDNVPVPRLLHELNAVVLENCVDLAAHGFEQELKEHPCSFSVFYGNEWGDDELGGPVVSNEQVKHPIAGLHIGDIEVKESAQQRCRYRLPQNGGGHV